MDFRPGTSDTAVTIQRVAQQLGLGDAHAAWSAKLGQVQPSASMAVPDDETLAASLALMGVAPEDTAEVIRTMPSPERDAESWWLLERSRELLAVGLANRDGNAEPLPPLPSELKLFPVHLILVAIDAIRQCHHEFGIPEDVTRETLAYLGRAMSTYRMSHGEVGMKLTRWDWLRFFGWLYQVGRLEVTPYRLRKYPKEAGPLFWYDEETIARLGSGFRTGDPALGIHVPATDPLTPETCDDALGRIRTAFGKVYPGEPLRVGTCTSWLLDDQLAGYLPADSNILSFQRRFHLVPGALDNDEAILHFVFGVDRPKELGALPQYTTLERAVVQHLRLGKHWRIRTGWLELHPVRGGMFMDCA